MLSHDYIGTEHLLLGLTGRCTGVPARALASLGITVEAARQQVEAISGQGQQAPPGHFQFTPQASKVLESSSRQARELGHNYVGTEHLLLGLIGEGDNAAVQVLNGLGVGITVRDGEGNREHSRSRRSDRPGTRPQRCSAWASGLPPAITQAQDAMSIEGPAPRSPLTGRALSVGRVP